MFWSNYTTITRRGYDITLPKAALKMLKDSNYRVSVNIKNNKPYLEVYTTTNKVVKKSKYVGTLRSWFGNPSFKDGNPCNFKKSNLIYSE